MEIHTQLGYNITMKRSVKVTLKFATKSKQRQIFALLQSYRSAVNFYIKELWYTKRSKDADTLALLENSRLSERYKQAALKQAYGLVLSTKKSAKVLRKHCSRPVFNGSAILDSRHIVIEQGEGLFDLVLKLSILKKGRRIIIPTKHTQMTRKWLAIPSSKFIQGCSLSEKGITLWIDVPFIADRQEGKVLGVDLGVNKLISDSDGKFYGTDFKHLSDKIRRKKFKSKARTRAFKERDNFIGRVVNQLPWKELKVIGVEDLTGIKTGKQNKRSKNFRKAMAPWIVRQCVKRIEEKASENRVRLIKVDPSYTSQTCPSCREVSKENRRGEVFKCIACGYAGDADYFGALNILFRTRQTLTSV